MGAMRAVVVGCLATVVALACSPLAGSRCAATAPPLTATDYEPVRGATSLWVSPDGSYVAAELIFVGETLPAVIKVIERASNTVVARARGSVVRGPNARGEVLYVDTSDPAHPTLRSTTREKPVAALPPVSSDFVRWSGFDLAATPNRLLVMREEAERVRFALYSLPDGSELVSRTLPRTEFALLAAAANPTEPILYLNGRTSGAPGAGAIVALDEKTLGERWRVEWLDGYGFDSHPALGLSGDGRVLAVYASGSLFTFDARRGTGGKRFASSGHAVSRFVGVPGRTAVVALRSFSASGETPEYSIEEVDLVAGGVAPLRADSGPPVPGALVVTGQTVLVAPGAAPRWP